MFAKKRGLTIKAGPPVHDDLVKRKFTATRPNQLWLTDITEHRTDEGKLYLCAIKDVCSNKIVGYLIDSRMKASLAVAAARNAIGQRTIDGTILHSDRGSQFRSNAFLRVLKNVLDRQRWATREELRLAIVVWIERTYHRKRRQRRLGKLTPIEFETINVALTAA